MVRVLIVEDSPVAAELLKHILASDSSLEVIGHAADGETAVSEVQRLKPDVITMDINLPGIDGFTATRRIMESSPTRIVIVSGIIDRDEVGTSVKALEAGALAVIRRPVGLLHKDYSLHSKQLLRMIRLMSEVQVVRRYASRKNRNSVPHSLPTSVGSIPSEYDLEDIHLVVIGASTGGPQVIGSILEKLPSTFPLPIVLVQHISIGFLGGYVEWLNSKMSINVQIAEHGAPMQPGFAYFAPDEKHLGFDVYSCFELAETEPVNGLRPSINYLFNSVADKFGKHTLAILLTGMGADGAEGLLKIRQAGGLTISQDAATSIVYGMPGEAVRIGASVTQMTPDQIAGLLLHMSDILSSNKQSVNDLR